MSTVHKSVRAIVVGSALLASSVFAGAGEVQASADSCRTSGVDCAIGDRGPRGGYVFYDAGSTQPWGRYLEAWPASFGVTNTWGAPTSVWRNPFGRAYDALSLSVRQNLDRRNTMVGLGNYNTQLMRANSSGVAQDFDNFMLRAQEPSGYWHIPSKDELDALYNAIAGHPAFESLRNNWKSVPHWTSSESEESFAWYQLFQDGTQFTDANGIINKLAGNKNYLTSAKHSGSNFPPTQLHVVPVAVVRTDTAAIAVNPLEAAIIRSLRDNAACRSSGLTCAVGDVGPAGGIIVHDAGRDESWGRYLEVAPQSCEIVRVPFAEQPTKVPRITIAERVSGKAIGAGARNTARIAAAATDSAAKRAADSTCGGFTDWFLPSKDELNEAFRRLSHGRTNRDLTPVGGFDRGYYWTSSDYNGSTAWSQYFADGQQFDREQNFSGNQKGPARPFLVRPMRAFKSGVGSSSTAPSVPSTTVTPAPGGLPVTIFITGERGTVSGKSGVTVSGSTTGLAAGSTLKSWLRFPGQATYVQGSVQPVVAADGSFTWSRKTGKRISVYFTSIDESKTSNRIVIDT
jgi:hypothetical protein